MRCRCHTPGITRTSEYAKYAVFPPGITADMIAANPEASRPDWVKPHTFCDDLAAMLDFSPQLAPDDTAIGDQARAPVALHRSDDHYRGILDRAAVGHTQVCMMLRTTARSAWTQVTDGGGNPTAAYETGTGTADRSQP
jgi:hypothetical protein